MVPVFVPNFHVASLPALNRMKLFINYPIIPRSSLRQFFQKLVLNMVYYNRTPVSTRNKLFTRSSQEYLSELMDRWDSSDDLTIRLTILILTIRLTILRSHITTSFLIQSYPDKRF